MKNTQKILFGFICFCLLSANLFAGGKKDESAKATGTSATTTAAPVKTAGSKSEAQLFVEKMGIGYNLGNTMDSAPGGTRGGKIANFETAWGAPVTTEEMIAGLKKYGINTVRIPVAWSNLMDPEDNYKINPDLMNRVEEIVNYVLKNDMYAIVNIHWDYGWICDLPDDYDETMARYTSFWNQISDRFKNYNDHLVFESLNEEGCFNTVWNRWGPNNSESAKKEAFDYLNNLNQFFVDLVRKSGGNNATRYLLIAGYATDIDLTCDDDFRMPKDPVNHQIVSVHYYNPSTFAIITEDASWGKAQSTWGTASDVAAIKPYVDKLKMTFVDKGIPVIIGEHGCPVAKKDEASVIKYISEVASAFYLAGMCPCLWDGSGDVYKRATQTFVYPAIGEMYLNLSKQSRQ